MNNYWSNTNRISN